MTPINQGQLRRRALCQRSQVDMIRHAIVPSVFSILVLCTAPPVSAQTPSSANDSPKLGFAASIASASGTVSPGLLVPIQIASRVRVEPEIAYTRSTSDDSSETSIGTVPVGAGRVSI